MERNHDHDEEELNEISEQQEEKELPSHWKPGDEAQTFLEGPSPAVENPKVKDFSEREIQNVFIEDIDLSDSPVNDASDFRKVSHDEMVEGFNKLETTVRPAVDQGADGEYFSELDESQGLDYEHGNRRIFDAFYGSDAIRLDKDNDHYTVVNGYHRFAVAKEMGIKSVPAWVWSG